MKVSTSVPEAWIDTFCERLPALVAEARTLNDVGAQCLTIFAYTKFEVSMFVTPKTASNCNVEEAGAGTPILFVHEFGGNHESWEPQMRFFARRHRVITYAARGYAPSDIPADMERYSQALARMMRWRCWMGSASRRRTSSACPWAASPPSISACARHSAPSR